MGTDILSCEGILVSLAKQFSTSTPALDIEDLVQEGWIEVWVQKDKYEEHKSSFSHWVYCIVRNRFLNILKTRKAQLLNSCSEDGLFVLENMVTCPKAEWRPGVHLSWVEEVALLSKEAQQVLEILNGEEASFFLIGGESSRTIRGKLRTFLFTNGYTQRQISSIFDEIRDFLNQRKTK